jgi:uncharacterized protein YidB (DUF937 family)
LLIAKNIPAANDFIFDTKFSRRMRRKIMTQFGSIIGETSERFSLTSDQSKALLSALLGFMSDAGTGGFSGFSRRFHSANLGETVSSWTKTGVNAAISKEQIESAFGAETVATLADRAGLDYATTVSALTFLLPETIDRLTPNGAIPDEQTLRAAANDLDDDSIDSTVGGNAAASAVSTEAFDRIGNATEDVAGKAHGMMNESHIDDPAAVGDRFSAGSAAISDQRLAENYADEFNDDSPLKWLAPLIITGLLVAAGFWFCGKSSSAPHASLNAGFDFSRATAIYLSRAKNDAG